MIDDERMIGWLVFVRHALAHDITLEALRLPPTIQHHLLTRGWLEFVGHTRSELQMSDAGMRAAERHAREWGASW